MGRRRLKRTVYDSSDEDQAAPTEVAGISQPRKTIKNINTVLSDEDDEMSMVDSDSDRRVKTDESNKDSIARDNSSGREVQYWRPPESPAPSSTGGVSSKASSTRAELAAEESARAIRGGRTQNIKRRRRIAGEIDSVRKDLGKGLELDATDGDDFREAEWSEADLTETGFARSDIDEDMTATTTWKGKLNAETRPRNRSSRRVGFAGNQRTWRTAGVDAREKLSSADPPRASLGGGESGEGGGRPRRAATSKKVDYARLNEGERSEDGSDGGDEELLHEESVNKTWRRERSKAYTTVGKDAWHHSARPESGKRRRLTVVEDSSSDDGELKEEQEEEEEEEGLTHAQIFFAQEMEDEAEGQDRFMKSIATSSSGHLEDAYESFGWYIEFLAKAVQGGGKGQAFMTRFTSKTNRHEFGDYRRAVKKFEDHLCTVRESIAGGGSWNQEFKTAVTSCPFVGFSDAENDPDPCAACHRRQCDNRYTMFLAGNEYDSNGMWTRERWDKLLPEGWDDPAFAEVSKGDVHETLGLGGTCRHKSHLYHTFLHYKLYLVSKIRNKLDNEGFAPDTFRRRGFRGFWHVEKKAVDELVELAELMANMKRYKQMRKTRPGEGVGMIRRWLKIPEEVVETEGAKLEIDVFRGLKDSSAEDDQRQEIKISDEDHDVRETCRDREATGSNRTSGRRAGGSGWRRTDRYGNTESEGSDDWIVDG